MKDAKLAVWIEPGLKDRIDRLAGEAHLSTSAFARKILYDECDKIEAAKKPATAA